ncbi:MAG: hypothetical protein OYK82_11835 [Gammaproteobacteria bacterium]|nr:hypothetical protein [Gammaproteobacteria bacterium]
MFRSLRRRAEALGVDVSGLTDEELEARIRENSRRLADQAAAGVGSVLKRSGARIARLGKALLDPHERR